MGKVTILEETTKNPITLIGKRAGICWGANISDDAKNYARGLECIKANHGRTLEFVNVEMVLDGYSARVIREWYTHIGGSPTRLQASTRYIDYESNFDFVMPKTINTPEKMDIYHEAMRDIRDSCNELLSLGVPREDVAMLLPLGMTTKIIDKRNLRSLVDMSRNRECSRAYWEFRDMFGDIKYKLSNYSEEWATLVEMIFHPKCMEYGYCREKKSCGMYYRKEK